jgi:hypothetical protein
MEFSYDKQDLTGQDGYHLVFYRSGQILSNEEFVTFLRDERFVYCLRQAMLGNDFIALRWESAAITSQVLSDAYQCVVLNDPSIERPANPGPFAQYLHAASRACVIHSNGKDAKLLIPCEGAAGQQYCHLRAFLQQAPDTQVNDLFQLLGRVLRCSITEQPIWLNTAGGGVAWLHIRVDSRPKYYQYLAYC